MKTKTRLTLQDAAPDAVKMIAGWPENTKRAVVAMIYASVNGVVERSAPDGSGKYPGFSGVFEMQPADKSKEATQSGQLFFPKELVSAPLQMASKPDFRSLRFAAEIVLERGAQPGTFQWQLNWLRAPENDDPLNELKRAIEADKTKKK